MTSQAIVNQCSCGCGLRTFAAGLVEKHSVCLCCKVLLCTVQILNAKPGILSEELRTALGMGENTPPPWLINMQRYGPPPSYPDLRVRLSHALIPCAVCAFIFLRGSLQVCAARLHTTGIHNGFLAPLGQVPQDEVRFLRMRLISRTL